MGEEDSQLSLSCAERGWRYSRLDEDVFLFDERSEYLARVDGRIARQLPGAAAVMGSACTEAGSLRTVLVNLARQRLDPESASVGIGADVDTGSPSAEPTFPHSRRNVAQRPQDPDTDHRSLHPDRPGGRAD
ncbi:MAG TPA: hypothetical protein VN327_16935 [Pseudonocardiaceae bacterium]|nr:hypothetical protein [Pseudonocardiaceae bacterium]